VDGGFEFQPTRDLLSDSLLFPGRGYWSHILTDGHRVFVFFLYGSGNTDTPVRIAESTDRGESWLAVRNISPDTGGEIRSVATRGNHFGVVYAVRGVKKILRSTDGGETWTRTNESLDYDARIALSPGVLHLVQRASNETEYRRSHDLGDSWVQTEYLSTVDGFSALDPAIAAGPMAGTERVVVAWRDSKYGCQGILGCSIIMRTGVTGTDSTRWDPERVLTDLPRGSQPAAAISLERTAVVWADEIVPNVTFHVAMRITGGLDTGWCPTVDITPETPYEVIAPAMIQSRKAVHVVWHQAVAPSPSTFRIFYRRGRFVQTAVGKGEEGIPSAASLGQNYPNPFNPKTTIPYTIDRRTDVTLRVLDLLGREVATLAAGTQEPGSYMKKWDARDVPSGIYFYRLTAGGRVETRKAVLLR
jgi:hypothetical protein